MGELINAFVVGNHWLHSSNDEISAHAKTILPKTMVNQTKDASETFKWINSICNQICLQIGRHKRQKANSTSRHWFK